jgi:hypothetical protein
MVRLRWNSDVALLRGFLVLAIIETATIIPLKALSETPQGAVVEWDNAALQGIRDSKLGAPMVARALAVVHTCIYDAWAAYDERAVSTQLSGALRRPAIERTEANKARAIAYAAYRALVDVLPVDSNSIYIPLMKRFGYDANDASTDIETPAGTGHFECSSFVTLTSIRT